MVFVCDRGCTTDGKPTRHANVAACPVVRQERAAAKTKTAPATEHLPDAAPEIPDEPKAAKAPEKTGWDKAVEFIRGPAKTVSAPEVPTKQEAYLLEGDDVVNFWQIIFSILELGFNLLCRFLEIKDLDPDLCDVKKSKASSLLISRNMRHVTSQLFISVGVQTKGEAQALIGEGEGIVSFGHIFFGIGMHFLTELPKSPVIKRWRAQNPLAAPAGPADAKGDGRAWWDFAGLFTAKPTVEAPKNDGMAGATPAAA
jgi:hypothetical protein